LRWPRLRRSRGRYQWSKLTPAATRLSVRYFEQATEDDPGDALAWARLALATRRVTANRDREAMRLKPLVLPAVLVPLTTLAQVDSDAGSPEQLIVTARKAEESLYSVPMSVQSLSGRFLDATDPSSLYTLQLNVPGLVLASQGMFGVALALRGVTSEGGGTLSVAPHFNGVYLGFSGLALARMFDVERVEVLKGPQGTLYGRNATGGSINVIARPPGQNFAAGVEMARGSFDERRIKGYVNLPAEKIAARIAVTASGSDGYIRNSVDDRRFGEQDYTGVRASLRAQPTDRLTIDLMAEHLHDYGANDDLWLPRADYLPDPHDIRLTTVTLADPFLDAKDDLVDVDVAYDLGPMTLRSLTGFARNVTSDRDDCVATPQLQGCVRGLRPLIYDQSSEELRLEPNAAGPSRWVAGVFFLDADKTQNYYMSRPGNVINDYHEVTEQTAYAAFGQVTHAFDTHWSLTGGLRFSHEVARETSYGLGSADNRVPISGDGSWDNTSSRLGFEYKPAEGAMLYVSVATGFKSGGITNELLPTGGFMRYRPEELTAHEVGLNVNLPGRRWKLLSSAFWYDFRDLQVRTVTILDDRTVLVIDNAARARVRGLDVAVTARLTPRLNLDFGGVWLPRREFVEYVNALTGDTLSGNQIARAPRWSSSAALEYSLPVRGVGELHVRVDHDSRSRFFFTKENDPVMTQSGYGLLNLFLRFDFARESWYLFGSSRNVTNTDYFNQMFIQSSPGYPRTYELGFGWRR
jgi:iron complex outermembrane receptor protein